MDGPGPSMDGPGPSMDGPGPSMDRPGRAWGHGRDGARIQWLRCSGSSRCVLESRILILRMGGPRF